MKAGDIVGLAALAGVVVAIWLGRRKGRASLARSLAAARAEGRASLTAELAATATATGGTVNLFHAGHS